jgi:hypothetical protein
VLYPSRPAPITDGSPLTRAAVDKTAAAAARGEEGSFESTALEFGQRLGSQIYDAYLAGRVAPGGLRRVFLAHLAEPGLARKVCCAVISKLKSISRPLARPAHA